MKQQSANATGRPLQHVLLIEHTPDDAELIQRQFHEAGAVCLFTVCRDLPDAMDALGSGTFDLILLELGLPDDSGLTALRQVGAVAPRIPIVVLTDNADVELATEALGYGAQDYIVKGQQDPRAMIRTARQAIDRNETIELREAKRLNSELMSVASHEMRTRLTVIRENVSLVLEGLLGPVLVEQRECLTLAVTNCDRLCGTIGGLVDTARLSAEHSRDPRSKTRAPYGRQDPPSQLL